MKNRLPTTPKEALLAAAQLIEDTNWTQGAFARNKTNEVVPVMREDACAFCMEGAIQRVEQGSTTGVNAHSHLRKFLRHKYPSKDITQTIYVPAINDTVLTLKEQAVALLREAAEWEGP